MKILHLCLGSFYIDKYSYQENILPKYHKKRGYDIEIIASLVTYDANGKYKLFDHGCTYMNEFQIPVTRLEYKKTKFNIWLRRYKGLNKALNLSGPDLIFVHGGQFWDTNIVKKYMKVNKNVKLVVDFHSDFNNSGRTWISKWILHRVIWKWRIKLIEKLASKIYCITPGVMRFVEQNYRIKSKLDLLPLGADTELIDSINKEYIRKKIRKDLHINETDLVIIHGGKLSDEKKTLQLIEAFSKLDDMSHLVIFGNPLNEYKAEFLNIIKGIDKIHYVGWLNTKEIYEHYFAADIACFPGGQSNLWQEAITCGLPLICEYQDDLKYLDLGGNVLFIMNSSVEQIETALSSLTNNIDKVHQMSNIAKEFGSNIFSCDKIAAKVISDVSINDVKV